MPNDVARTASAAHASSRLRNAAFAPIGEEGRAELVATRLIQTITSGAYVQVKNCRQSKNFQSCSV